MTESGDRAGRPESRARLSRVERRRIERERERRDRWRRWRSHRFPFWLEFPVLVLAAILVAFVLKTGVVEPFYIPSSSMEATLHGCPGCHGDRVLVNKFVYHLRTPYRGEIVVFQGENSWRPESTTAPATGGNAVIRAVRSVAEVTGFGRPDGDVFIKRVIGLPGDTVACCDARGRVTVDGHGLDEPYIYQNTPLPNRSFGPVTVPSGRLWVMGDHRLVSADSRSHLGDRWRGTISIRSVLGRAFAIAWPPGRASVLPRPRIDPATVVRR